MSGKSDDDAPTRKVGYKSPPEDHRFKTGNKGNPWGRNGKPKPPVAFLDGSVELTVEGRRKRITRAEAIEFALFKEAMQGNVSAAKQLFERDKLNANGVSVEAPNEPLPEQESAALERFIERRLQDRMSPVEKPARKRRKTP
jgi:hypothetical protein